MNAVTSLTSPSRSVSTLSANGRYAAAASSQAVEGEARLAVGLRPDRLPPPRAGQRERTRPFDDRVARCVPGGQRRHRERRVLDEQRGERVDVAALPGGDVTRDEFAERAVAERAQVRLLGTRRHPLGHRGPGALQSAVRRRRARSTASAPISAALKPSTSRRISTARWLAGRCCSAATNASSTPSRCSYRASGVALPVGQAEGVVRVRLEPDRLGDRRAGRRARLGRRAEVVRQHPLAAPLELGEAHVGGDRVQPRPRRGAFAQAGRAAPRADQRLLQGVLGVVHRAEHAVAMRVQLGSVQLDQPGEVRARPSGRVGQDCSTTISVCPVGSRNQNIGGTGSPIRETSASTSTPSSFMRRVGGVDVRRW